MRLDWCLPVSSWDTSDMFLLFTENVTRQILPHSLLHNIHIALCDSGSFKKFASRIFSIIYIITARIHTRVYVRKIFSLSYDKHRFNEIPRDADIRQIVWSFEISRISPVVRQDFLTERASVYFCFQGMAGGLTKMSPRAELKLNHLFVMPRMIPALLPQSVNTCSASREENWMLILFLIVYDETHVPVSVRAVRRSEK